MPGLVDAHCHIGLDDHGGSDEEHRGAGDPRPRRRRTADPRLRHRPRHQLDPRAGRPAAADPGGRHIARTQRYIRNYAHEVEPDALVEHVVREAQRSDGWVKLVGDWISREEGDLAPSFPADAFAAAIAAAHDHGAKVTAHCFGTSVLPGLIDAGIDCIEHGNGLTSDLIDAMVVHGTALVPTVMQTAKFPDYAEAGRERFPDYSRTMDDLFAARRDVLMQAHEAGVPLYAGSDGGGVGRHGNIAGEVVALAEMGLPVADALGAASWRAREWLGGRLSSRALPPTSWSTRATRWRTSRCCSSRPASCCAAGRGRDRPNKGTTTVAPNDHASRRSSARDPACSWRDPAPPRVYADSPPNADTRPPRSTACDRRHDWSSGRRERHTTARRRTSRRRLIRLGPGQMTTPHSRRAPGRARHRELDIRPQTLHNHSRGAPTPQRTARDNRHGHTTSIA